jgi:hypothetical protein
MTGPFDKLVQAPHSPYEAAAFGARGKAIGRDRICCPDTDPESTIGPVGRCGVALKNSERDHETDVSGLNLRIALSNLPGPSR